MHVSDDMIRPELQRFGRIARRAVPYLTPTKIHVINALAGAQRGIGRKSLNYEQHFIDRPDGSQLRLCVYTSLNRPHNVPGILYLHGGGYVMERPETEAFAIQRFISATNAVIVAPDYRLASEAPYPAALNDAYLALKWLQQHGAEYGMRDNQIMVAGASAGGGLTAALTLYNRDHGNVGIAFQVPLYPMLDDRMVTESSQNNDAPVWNTLSNKLAWQMYLANQFAPNEVPIYAAPSRATDFHDLPATCTFIGDVEPFYDETMQYIQKLKDSGVPTFSKVMKGCFHGFDMVCPNSASAQEAVHFLTETLQYATTHFFQKQPE
ncbi:Lipase [Furfurilactobacillus rossiae]|uniref:alpha/beta hydrolase n=1 Tax=Furfurilactobacillus rossiae TaxID=231049 RepID=UPI0015BB01C1|nr:alpha/beta hydrolase [Furfurilactobacillus rossiae]MCF6166334.1 alpha/beta hydrolase [Furfurilactobacillus rossiae]QLE65097.1 Lipase [Furfurilactobacillus rossiae]